MSDQLDSGTLMVALTGVTVYQAFMPDLADIRKASTDSATARDVRNGIAVSSAALIGAGLLMACACQDARPLWLAAGMAALMGVLYEVTLQLDGEQ